MAASLPPPLLVNLTIGRGATLTRAFGAEHNVTGVWAAGLISHPVVVVITQDCLGVLCVNRNRLSLDTFVDFVSSVKGPSECYVLYNPQDYPHSLKKDTFAYWLSACVEGTDAEAHQVLSKRLPDVQFEMYASSNEDGAVLVSFDENTPGASKVVERKPVCISLYGDHAMPMVPRFILHHPQEALFSPVDVLEYTLHTYYKTCVEDGLVRDIEPTTCIFRDGWVSVRDVEFELAISDKDSALSDLSHACSQKTKIRHMEELAMHFFAPIVIQDSTMEGDGAIVSAVYAQTFAFYFQIWKHGATYAHWLSELRDSILQTGPIQSCLCDEIETLMTAAFISGAQCTTLLHKVRGALLLPFNDKLEDRLVMYANMIEPGRWRTAQNLRSNNATSAATAALVAAHGATPEQRVIYLKRARQLYTESLDILVTTQLIGSTPLARAHTILQQMVDL